ncbi:MAG: primosomal protein N' [Verrucomicrobia bacterium]|nr:primosomal protein N' [Verrucomicrobiota bacterium]
MPTIARVVVRLALDRVFDYLVPPELVAGAAPGTPVTVPFGKSERQGYIVDITDHSERADLKSIVALAGKQALIRDRVMELARWISDYYVAPIETAVHAVLPAAVRKRGAAHLDRLRVVRTEMPDAEADIRVRHAAKQAAVLASLKAAGGEQWLARLESEAPGAAGAVRGMAKKGLVRLESGEIRRDPEAGRELVRTEPLALMPQQADALATLRTAIDTGKPPVVLLFGVTGSGKTEVYLQAIAHAMTKGKGAIVLVPEIALTPQTVDRFRARFGDTIAVLHSHLSDGERHDEWHRVHSGRARIVVGARSALFAPVADLGLIVVDEEHEPTYKQEEAPRYHARDAAVMRGRLEGCAVVLGSATPSLESWQNAKSGKYAMVRMPHRVDHRDMPLMRIVDLRAEASREGRANIFSRELVQALHDRLARGEQSILFLNRRGFASSLVCPSCGFVVRCEHCSVAMVFHKQMDRLVCHLCGATRGVPAACPAPECGDPAIRHSGVGTERIEEVLHKLFPKARVARMDSDTMTRKDDYRRVLGEFRTGRLDILLGTQMIAKGLDFPNVTLVGVVQADHALHLSDFRAGERTFQLLTQVAGRAGRGDVSGEVLVQTRTPFHPSIQAARRLDAEAFYDQELEFRRATGYPPFSHFIACTVRAPDDAVAARTTAALAAQIKARLGALAVVGDPAPATIARIRGQYRHQVMIRAARMKPVLGPLRELWQAFPWPRGTAGVLDIDAVSLL